jgi:hypothetical protein
MAYEKIVPTAYPSIANATWTKVNTLPPEERSFFSIWNCDTANVYRFLILVQGLTSVYVNATYGATAGKLLSPAADANHVGGGMELETENQHNGDIWVYQGSGGALTTLAVDERA